MNRLIGKTAIVTGGARGIGRACVERMIEEGAQVAMRDRASLLLQSVGLTPWLHVPAAHLSGGQQQRVAVARALAMKPSLILADEPTGNLDTKSADGVFELLQSVCKEQGTAVLFVTHNPLLAGKCQKTIEVVDGQIS